MKSLLILPGDGVGPEVVAAACRVLDCLIEKDNLVFDVKHAPFGLAAVAEHGAILPDVTLNAALSSDAILFGAMGGPGYNDLPLDVRHSGSILTLRRRLALCANLRPSIGFPELADAVPYKAALLSDSDLLIVREGTGGIYFGEPRGIDGEGDEAHAINSMIYSAAEIIRIARVAFDLAGDRTGRLCSVDKSNVLEVGRLWRQVVSKIGAEEYPDIELSHMLVDNCAFQLARDPRQFDVLVMSNMFGDILSDGAAALMGSLGMAASASLPSSPTQLSGPALFEPVHGSAPDIEGQGIANPTGAIWSLALALQYALDAADSAARILTALRGVFANGIRTKDIAGEHKPVSTDAFTDAVIEELCKN